MPSKRNTKKTTKSTNNTSTGSSGSTQTKSITQDQMSSLDATDATSSRWNDQVLTHLNKPNQPNPYLLSQITNQTSLKQQQLLWGGRGKGGRGMARVTIQPRDIILPNVTLEYVSDAKSGCVGSKVLLSDAYLKLLSCGSSGGGDDESENTNCGRVYALVGRNGCGKSTLLKRMNEKKIPGFFNLHLKSMYIPQEVFDHDTYDNDNDNDGGDDDDDDDEGIDSGTNETKGKTPLEVVMGYRTRNKQESKDTSQKRMEELEEELEKLMENLNTDDGNDSDNEDDETNNETEMERLCTEISSLEDQLNGTGDGNNKNDDEEDYQRASQVLSYFGIDESKQKMAMNVLSGGQKKKVLLACALFCDIDILLLDEPTNHLDMQGIIQLRGLIQTISQRKTTIVLISHDVDLINHVATDVIHFSNQSLNYYRGNYIDFQIQKQQQGLHKTRQQQTLDKQRSAMMKTIDNLQKKSSGGSRESKKKVSRAVNNRKKKLERHGIEKDEHGHRWTAQNAGTGMKVGAMNNLDASTRKQKKYSQMMKQSDINVAPVPEKEVQFEFRNTSCQWHEPLVSALDVGHGFEVEEEQKGGSNNINMIFDGVDLCVDEKSTTCILGENQSGKTTLLKILSGQMSPKEGNVRFAHNANVAYFDQHKADNLIVDGMTKYGSTTSSISLLMSMYPKKTEQEIRSELVSFGLSSQQSSTYVQYLSGGERCRLCLVMLMLSDPHVLIFDEPSNHLDPESVDALAYGIKKWNGTVVLVSHDVHLIRQLEAKCYILMSEGKLKYVQGGIDSYLKSLSMQESKKLEVH